MKISKKEIESITKKHYLIEKDGEKLIRRDRLEELKGIISGRYDNAGWKIEDTVDGEKLIVFSLNKNGIKSIFENKIEKLNDKWRIDEIVDILKWIKEQYGLNIFRDRKRCTGIISDLLCKFEEEYPIIKMLFNEGIFEVIDTGCSKGEDIYIAEKGRLNKFCDKMGLGNEARESAVEILMRTFIL